MRSTPLRVAIALESSGPGGAENMVLALAEALRSLGDAPVVATMRPGWMTERAEAAGIPVWVVPQRPGLDPAWSLRFARRLRRERIAAFHGHEFAMSVYGGAAARLAGIPSVSTLHGRHWVTDRPRRVLAYRILCRLGMRVVAVSQDLAAFLADRMRLPRSAIEVVHNGIPIPDSVSEPRRAAVRRELREALGLTEDAPVLIAVGNLYPVKDHATLLRAAASLPGVHVWIAGRGGEQQHLEHRIRELGLSDRVRLLGLRPDIDRLLRAADAFVQPSRSEGLPLAILEAMAAGLPVVATQVGGVPEAVVDGETGWLVEPAAPEKLAKVIERLLRDPEQAARMGAAGRKRVVERFSARAMAARYRALYARRGSR